MVSQITWMVAAKVHESAAEKDCGTNG